MISRNSISLGGDSDTLAAITGSIAEVAYGIPDWIKDKTYSYLDEHLKDVVMRWENKSLLISSTSDFSFLYFHCIIGVYLISYNEI